MKPTIPPLSKLLGKFETTGEIFVMIDIQKGITPTENGFHIPDDLLRGNVYRIYCINQPRIKHYGLGECKGFERRLSFQAIDVKMDIYNGMMRSYNNLRMIFFAPDKKGRMQMLYNPPFHTKINIVGSDEDNHIVRASVHDGPNKKPISMLVHEDGSPVTLEEFEEYVEKK